MCRGGCDRRKATPPATARAMATSRRSPTGRPWTCSPTTVCPRPPSPRSPSRRHTAPTIYSAFGTKAKICNTSPGTRWATLDIDRSNAEASRSRPAQGLRLAATIYPTPPVRAQVQTSSPSPRKRPHEGTSPALRRSWHRTRLHHIRDSRRPPSRRPGVTVNDASTSTPARATRDLRTLVLERGLGPPPGPTPWSPRTPPPAAAPVRN